MELMGASVVTEVDGNGSHALLDATTARRVTSAGRRSKFASRFEGLGPPGDRQGPR